VTSSGDQASPTATPSSEGSASGGAAQSPVNFRRDVLDILHLAEQTGADSGLQRELLDLFVRQSAEFMAQIRGVSVAEPGFLHRLKGSARAIGAFELADTAAELERGQSQAERLAAALRRTLAAIEAHLRNLPRPPEPPAQAHDFHIEAKQRRPPRQRQGLFMGGALK